MPQRVTADLAGRPEWMRLCETWAEARRIVAMPRMSYPFSSAGRARLLKALGHEAKATLAGLVTDGAMAGAEAELIGTDLKSLAARVAKYRTTELRHATCYRMSPPKPAAVASMERLLTRLSLLGELVASGRVHSAVMEKVLPAIQEDLDVLGDGEKLGQLKEPRKVHAAGLREEIGQDLAKLKKMMGESK